MKAKYFASCPKGLEDLLVEEAKSYGAQDVLFKVKGGLQFDLPENKLFEFFLGSRVASRFYLKLQHFKIEKLDDLHTKNVNYPWTEVMGANQSLKVQTLFDFPAKKAFRNSMVASLKLKDAIVDHFRQKTGKRPDVETSMPDVQFLLRIEGGQTPGQFYATTWLDLTGTPLSNRGYRPPKMSAPLRENLAAGLVLSTDWDSQHEFLLDPMCGSGTLLIEAQLIRLGIAPTYLRVGRMIERQSEEFAMQRLLWLLNNPKRVEAFQTACDEVYQQAQKALTSPVDFPLYGVDNHPKALEDAKVTMRLALMNDSHIHISAGNALSVRPPEYPEKGLILTNPPYGERLGASEDLEDLYYDFGEVLKSEFKGHRAYIFTGSPELRKQISLKTAQRQTFFNGDIECRLLKYELY